MDIETNPGPENICNRLNDNQRTLLNKIRRTQLQLIKHQHHLDFLLAQTAQHTVPKGLIPKSVPNANLQANLYNLWYQNTLIFAQSQMHLLVKHHEHSIINLHSELNNLWYNLSFLCDYHLLLQIQQNISHSCINLKNKLQSKKSRKLKRDLPNSRVNIIRFSAPIPVDCHSVNLSYDRKMYQPYISPHHCTNRLYSSMNSNTFYPQFPFQLLIITVIITIQFFCKSPSLKVLKLLTEILAIT